MSVMFFVLSKILSFLLSPITWIIILCIISWRNYAKPSGKKWLATACVVLVVCTNPFIVNMAMRAWEVRSYSTSAIHGSYSLGIVMGGALKFYNTETNRIVYSSSVDRVLQSMQLQQSGRVEKLLITGGSGFVNMPQIKESLLLKSMMMHLHFNDSDIITESNSRNTYENAVYTAQIIKQKFPHARLLVITSAIHIRRTRACFSKQGLHADYFPVDERSGTFQLTLDKTIVPGAECITAWEQLLHEWVGMAMYKIAGYI